MKPEDTYKSSYLKAQRYFCVRAASKVLKAHLSHPHPPSGIPFAVLEHIAFDWQAVVFNLQCTLHFVKPPRASQWPKSHVDGGGELLASFLFLAVSFVPAAGYLWNVQSRLSMAAQETLLYLPGVRL